MCIFIYIVCKRWASKICTRKYCIQYTQTLVEFNKRINLTDTNNGTNKKKNQNKTKTKYSIARLCKSYYIQTLIFKNLCNLKPFYFCVFYYHLFIWSQHGIFWSGQTTNGKYSNILYINFFVSRLFFSLSFYTISFYLEMIFSEAKNIILYSCSLCSLN